MEESLLLLKRQFCWQLDDVVIGAMKVTPRKPGSKEPPMKTKAYDFNPMASQLGCGYLRVVWNAVNIVTIGI